MKSNYSLLFLLMGLAAAANAHFVFVVPQAGGGSAVVILSEDLKPSSEVDIGLIAGTKLSLRGADGQETPLTLVKGEHAYLATFAGTGLVHGLLDFGVTERAGKSFDLLYHPKTILGDAFDPKSAVGVETPVEIVPVGKPGALKLKLLVNGKPEPDAEIMVILPDGTQKKVKTDSAGLSEELNQTGRYGAWARHWDATPGERDGKKYAELRHYATLVFDAPATATATAITATRFSTLPQATSSFGAVASDGWLYVYGGHIARTHSYSTESVSGRFDRLSLSEPSSWQPLPAGPGLQGMNLAAYGGKIYRIGGMAPRNKPGEKEANYSTAECARFDPEAKHWESLPPLPEPRSSHDVVVIGDTLIVAGGWALKGLDGQQWMDTLEILDLSAKTLEWKPAPQPFKRRALITAAFAGKMWVLGGMDEKGNITHEVAVYNPADRSWTKAPDLPGGETNGFAPAACVEDGGLYVSVADGTLYRLNEAKQAWEKIGAATPRIAHRLAAGGKSVLVIGGAAKGNNSDLVEAVAVTR